MTDMVGAVFHKTRGQMPRKRAVTLRNLRVSITDRQRAILDDVWAHVKKTNIGLPERPLFDRYGKATLLHEANQLGGSIIYSIHEENKIRYNVGLVGIVLTSDGPRLEKILERYLITLRDAYAKDKEIERFSSKDLASWAPDLGADDLASLRQVLYRAHGTFASSIGGWNAEEWFVSVDNEVVELKNVDNWSTYIEGAVMKRYDSRLPAGERERMTYHAARSKPNPMWDAVNRQFKRKRQTTPHSGPKLSSSKKLDLSFLTDDGQLRSILENDWNEACQHVSANAWKSCVLLCAGVVEGLLLWQLEHAQKGPGSAIDVRYDGEVLSTVIRMSKEQGLLGEDEVFLTEWARIFRNTIHPGNQRRTERTPTRKDADLALKVVQVMAQGVRGRARAIKAPALMQRKIEPSPA